MEGKLTYKSAIPLGVALALSIGNSGCLHPDRDGVIAGRMGIGEMSEAYHREMDKDTNKYDNEVRVLE